MIGSVLGRVWCVRACVRGFTPLHEGDQRSVHKAHNNNKSILSLSLPTSGPVPRQKAVPRCVLPLTTQQGWCCGAALLHSLHHTNNTPPRSYIIASSDPHGGVEWKSVWCFFVQKTPMHTHHTHTHTQFQFQLCCSRRLFSWAFVPWGLLPWPLLCCCGPKDTRHTTHTHTHRMRAHTPQRRWCVCVRVRVRVPGDGWGKKDPDPSTKQRHTLCHHDHTHNPSH